MARKKNSSVNPFLGFAAIAVALYTVLFGGVRSFKIEDAEHMFSGLASHLSEEANRRGKEAKLQYSNVEVNGFAYDKWARIYKLSMDFIYQQWQGGARISLSTEAADLIPDHSNTSRLVLRLNNAINIISGSELLAMLQPVQPVSYSVNLKPSTPSVYKHHITVPGNVAVITLDPKREMLLRLLSPVEANITFFENEKRLNSEVTSGVIETMADNGTWRLDSASIHHDSTQKDAEHAESRGTMTFDNITFSNGAAASVPFTVSAAWRLKQQRNISGATDASVLSIEHALMTTGDAKISVNGTVNFDIDDTPYGEVVLEIYNPKDIVKSGWILEDKKALAISLLSMVAGDDVESYTHVSVAISRAKNGEWKVGKLLLSELLDKGFLDLFTFSTQEKNEQDKHQETSAENQPS